VLVTPSLVQIMAGDADNFITNIHIGRTFNLSGNVPRMGADVPRWLGETIGFWDGDALITWTSNVQGWISHGGFEFSSRLQSIEIYTPRRDGSGTLISVKQETLLYDPEAFVEPVRIVQSLDKLGDLNEGDPFPIMECIPQSFPVDGHTTPMSPGQTFQYTLPDIFGRPWAQTWERHHEDGMERPKERPGRFGL
jgi:hypothetical protein